MKCVPPEKVITTSSVPVSPAAGTLLVGRRVLARRHADGFYYGATIKSQIVHDKFLVEFGPSIRGKYSTMAYQVQEYGGKRWSLERVGWDR